MNYHLSVLKILTVLISSYCLSVVPVWAELSPFASCQNKNQAETGCDSSCFSGLPMDKNQQTKDILKTIEQIDANNSEKQIFFAQKIAAKLIENGENNLRDLRAMLDCFHNQELEDSQKANCEEQITNLQASIQMLRPQMRFHLALAKPGDVISPSQKSDSRLAAKTFQKSINMDMSTDSQLLRLKGSMVGEKAKKMEPLDANKAELSAVLSQYFLEQKDNEKAWQNHLEIILDDIGKRVSLDPSIDGIEFLKKNGYLKEDSLLVAEKFRDLDQPPSLLGNDPNATIESMKKKQMLTDITKRVLTYNRYKTNPTLPEGLHNSPTLSGHSLLPQSKFLYNEKTKIWDFHRDQFNKIRDTLPILDYLGAKPKNVLDAEWPDKTTIRDALLLLLENADNSKERIVQDLDESRKNNSLGPILKYIQAKDIVNSLLSESPQYCMVAAKIDKKKSDKDFLTFAGVFAGVTAVFMGGGFLLSALFGPAVMTSTLAIAGAGVGLGFYKYDHTKALEAEEDVVNRLSTEQAYKRMEDLTEAEQAEFYSLYSMVFDIGAAPELGKAGYWTIRKAFQKDLVSALSKSKQAAGKALRSEQASKVIKLAGEQLKNKIQKLFEQPGLAYLERQSKIIFKDQIAQWSNPEDQINAGRAYALLLKKELENLGYYSDNTLQMTTHLESLPQKTRDRVMRTLNRRLAKEGCCPGGACRAP